MPRQGGAAGGGLRLLPDEAVLGNPDWVAPVLFVLRRLRPLRWFGLFECRGEDAARPRDVAQDAAIRLIRAVRPRPDRDWASHGALTRPWLG